MPFGGMLTMALVGAGGQIAGGLLGKSAGNLTNNQKQAYNLLNYNAQGATPLNQQWNQQGKDLIGQGQNVANRGMATLGQARNAYAGPQNYFQSLLSGNQAQTTSALAPDINRIEGQTQNALQSTSNLAARGGGRSGTLFNLPFQAQSNISGLYNQVRPMAAQGMMGVGAGLGNVGQAQGNLGLGMGQLGVGAGNLGANYMNLGNNAAGTMFGAGTQGYNQQYQAGQGLGSLFSGVLKNINFGSGGGFGGGPAYGMPGSSLGGG